MVTVVDRMLWRIGRRAARAIEAESVPLDALRGFLSATTDAVRDVTSAASFDLAAAPGALAVAERHERYLVGVIEELLAAAVDDGSLPDVDIGALAVVLAGLGATLASTAAQARLRTNPIPTTASAAAGRGRRDHRGPAARPAALTESRRVRR